MKRQKKKIFIRVDANRYIGTGHMIRCISLADACLSRGFDVLFVVADHDGDYLLDHGRVEVNCINSNWSEMDEEIGILSELIKKNKPCILIVDSYGVTQKYFEAISALVSVVYIDDLNSDTWNVDYLINYNIFSDVFDYSTYNTTRTKLILGSIYAPLRREFLNLPKHSIKSNVTDILLSMGGADPNRVTELFLENICPIFEKISFHLVVGALNPRLDKIKALAGENVFLHINEQNMSNLMLSCDIAVAAAGSTLYELCACGTPTIAYSLADNQMIAVEEFARKGIMLSAGDSRINSSFIRNISDNIELLVNNQSLRYSKSNKMHSIVDGNGASRIVDILIAER